MRDMTEKYIFCEEAMGVRGRRWKEIEKQKKKEGRYEQAEDEKGTDGNERGLEHSLYLFTSHQVMDCI